MISLTINADETGRTLESWKKNILFGLAKGLTTVAIDARDGVKKQLPQRFIIRGSWAAKGIRAKSATRDHLTSSVLDIDPWLARHEESFLRTKDTHEMSMPYGARRSVRSTTPRRMWPGQLLTNKKKYFIGSSQFSEGAVWQRVGRKKLKLMYVFINPVQVPDARFEFNETVREVVMHRIQNRLQEGVDFAMRTAR